MANSFTLGNPTLHVMLPGSADEAPSTIVRFKFLRNGKEIELVGSNLPYLKLNESDINPSLLKKGIKKDKVIAAASRILAGSGIRIDIGYGISNTVRRLVVRVRPPINGFYVEEYYEVQLFWLTD